MVSRIKGVFKPSAGTGANGPRDLAQTTASIIILTLVLFAGGAHAQNPPFHGERSPLNGYYEPSGIVQMHDGRMILVEDEKKAAISLLTPRDDLRFAGEPLRLETLSGLLFGQSGVGALDDLEAITMGKDGYVYAITSHSRTPPGNRFKRREKLVRFRVDGSRAVDFGLLTSLRDQMANLHKGIAKAADIRDATHDDHLSVEGMVYDSTKDRLLIGMRGPVIGGKAVVLVIPDTETAFSDATSSVFADEPIFLDLDKGGIRAMAYDPKLDGFLIVSRREKKGKGFKLWYWAGGKDQPPRRIRLGKNIDLLKAEGVTPIRFNGFEKIMLVFDSGRRSRGRNGQYMLLSYDQLRLSQ